MRSCAGSALCRSHLCTKHALRRSCRSCRSCRDYPGPTQQHELGHMVIYMVIYTRSGSRSAFKDPDHELEIDHLSYLGLLLWNVFENRKRTFFSGRKTKRTEFDRQSYHGRKFPDMLIGKRAPPREQLQQYHHVRRLYSSRGAVHKKYRVLHRCTSPKL